MCNFLQSTLFQSIFSSAIIVKICFNLRLNCSKRRFCISECYKLYSKFLKGIIGEGLGGIKAQLFSRFEGPQKKQINALFGVSSANFIIYQSPCPVRPFVNDVTIFGLGQGFCDNQTVVVKEVCQKLLEVIYGPPLCCIGSLIYILVKKV